MLSAISYIIFQYIAICQFLEFLFSELLMRTYNSACINSEMWILLEISADPGSELELIVVVGMQVSGSEIEMGLVSNWG